MTVREAIKRIVFPRVCIGCGNALTPLRKDDVFMCGNCVKEFREEDIHVCPRCGFEAYECRCAPECLRRRCRYMPLSLCFYRPEHPEYLSSRIIYTLKNDPDVNIARFFADMCRDTFARYRKMTKCDLSGYIVIYPPRSRRAYRQSGFDHMKCVAELVADRLGLAFDEPLERIGGTQQKNLESEAARFENAQKSYAIAEGADVRGKSYFLIDDVMMTGATMAAVIDVLREAGAKDVFVCTLFKDVPVRKT